MKTTTFNKRDAIVFKHFNRKGYSLFAALGKVVVIGVLAVPTLTYAPRLTALPRRRQRRVRTRSLSGSNGSTKCK